MHKLLALAAAAAILAPAAAHAQPRDPAAIPFGTMDRADTVSNAGVSSALVLLTGEEDNATALRLEFWGQYVHETGLGAMMQFPVNFLFEDGADPGVGNLELGVMYVAELDPYAKNKVIARFAVGVPTASDEFENAISNFAGTMARLTDFSLAVPNTIIRLGGSYVTHAGSLVARADVGFDIDAEGDVDPLFRANISAGTYIGETGIVLLEIVNLVGFDELFEDHSIHSIAATAGTANGMFSASFIMPLDDEISGDVFGFMVRAGGSF